MISRCLLCLLVLALSAAVPRTAVADEAAPNVNHAVNQARFFVRKGWYEDARLELDKVLDTPGAEQNQELQLLAAQVCYELLDIACAVEHARLAAELEGLSADPQLTRQANELLDYLSGFGFLDVRGPQPGVISRLQLDLVSTIFDPEAKKFVNSQALAIREKVTLPITIAVPAGDYQVNGHAVTVEPGETVELVLPMDALGAKGLAALQVTRLEVASGFGMLMGSRVSNLQPGLEVQLGVVQPVGRAFVGATLDWSLRSFRVEDYAARTDLMALSGGPKVGMELFIDGPFAVRPALGYRYGLLPGIAFDCTESGGISCVPREDGSDSADSGTVYDSTFYATSRVHVPYGELALDYRQAGRSTAWGMGLRVAADALVGSVPESTQATNASDDSGTTVPVQVTDGDFLAMGLRLLANLSIAF